MTSRRAIAAISWGIEQHPPARRRRIFWAVVVAHFFSFLADNALLIAAIALLMERHAANWMAPALRLLFYFSYVLLAPLAGAVADAFPKGLVMLVSNLFKLADCGLLLMQVHPLTAYALVDLGVAAYSPAKYGILPEILPPEELVAANPWIEVGGLHPAGRALWQPAAGWRGPRHRLER